MARRLIESDEALTADKEIVLEGRINFSSDCSAY
jgi:hypothetical protein